MTSFTITDADAAELRNVTARVGTPFYLYKASALRERVAALREQLPYVDFFYSLKANPNMNVVGVLVDAGTGAEVSSRLELETALAAGATPDRILMVGPGKSEDELQRAVALGLKAIVIESIEELSEIDRLAAYEGRIQSVAIRVNPDFKVSGARLAMSGRATQFGVDQTCLSDAVRRLQKLPHLRLVGLHVYMGTRILSEATLAENTRQVLALAETLTSELNQPLEFVDVGGGFGVPYYDNEAELDISEVGKALRKPIQVFCIQHPKTRVAIELGRYLVAEAGYFVTSVRRTKLTKGERFVICDGGSNVHSAAAGQGVFRRNFPVTIVPRVPRKTASAAQTVTITGPLCTPMDLLAKDVELAAPVPGDLICIHQSGAYGPSASPVDFLGFGAPAEVLADNDRLVLARARPNCQARLEAQTPQPITPGRTSSLEKSPTAPFNHVVLDRLASLRLLFERTGEKLEDDPESWSDLWADATVRALTTIGVPAEFNGFPLAETELGIVDCPRSLHVALIQRLAQFDASCVLALPGPSLSGGAVLATGSDTQIARFFRAYRDGPQTTFFAVTEPDVGSDASRGSTVLRKDDRGRLTLSGKKMLVGGVARAAIGLVFARMEPSKQAVLVMIEPNAVAKHVSITRLSTSGLCGADLCTFEMHDILITQDMLLGSARSGKTSLRDGFMAINSVFEQNRPVVAALALGNARGMLDRLERAGLGSRFEDAVLRYTALTNRLASVVTGSGKNRPRSHQISEIKFQAVAFSDALIERIAAEAPHAMLSDALLRRKMRDAKAFEYMEGTSNIHVLNAFRSYMAGVPT